MIPDNDSIPMPESDGAMAALQIHIESAGPAARGQLLRASDIDRDFAPASSLAQTLVWIRQFLGRPHPELGRTGPVCPFTPLALGLDTIWMTEIAESEPDPQRIIDVIGRYRDLFAEIEPRSGAAAVNKCVLVVFPHLGANGAMLVDDIQNRLKGSFVDLGLMLGEFHATNQSPGLRNPEFRPLRSPLPMLAIRNMVESDLPFLRRDLDTPQVRSSYLRSYLRRLGGSVRRNYFDQAVDALVAAELQLRESRALEEARNEPA